MQHSTRYRKEKNEMKYALLIYPGTTIEAIGRMSEDEQRAIMSEYGALVQEPGVFSSEQLHTAESATTVRVEDGRTITTEGPFASETALYQARNAGRLPRRVVIHKTQAFRDEEVDGCIDAWGRTDEIECVQVVTSNDWRAVRLLGPRTKNARSTPDSWPVERGTLIPFSDRSVLLFINGDAPSVAIRGHYFQGGKGIPRPITLLRHAGAGPLESLGEDALALSKMDWNNDALLDSLPVTIEYSKRLSQTIAHATSLPSGTYPYRLFM
jgi:hypothetical protein